MLRNNTIRNNSFIKKLLYIVLLKYVIIFLIDNYSEGVKKCMAESIDFLKRF